MYFIFWKSEYIVSGSNDKLAPSLLPFLSLSVYPLSGIIYWEVVFQLKTEFLLS